MSLFVLGRSRTGKSPFAKEVARYFSGQHIMASEWVRRHFNVNDYRDRTALIEAMTRFSVNGLKSDPHTCVNFIRGKYDLDSFCVIEGLRNPSDFIQLFDPRKDAVVVLERIENEQIETEFEKGIEVIKAYLSYLQKTGMLEKNRVMTYRFKEFYSPKDVYEEPIYDEVRDANEVWEVGSLEQAMTDFCLVAFDRLFLPADSLRQRYPGKRVTRHVHSDFEPIRCRVRAEYLYDMDPTRVGQHLDCNLIAFSSYLGQAPTFKVLLDDGTVFSCIPPSALEHGDKQGEPRLELAELVYHNCPADDFCINKLVGLEGPVNAFFKRRNIWLSGEYLLTIDWYRGNDLLHLIKLENGQYAMLPHHKLKFKAGCRSFQPFRKMHTTWSVPKEQTATSCPAPTAPPVGSQTP